MDEDRFVCKDGKLFTMLLLNHKNLTCEGRKKDFWSEYLKFRANHDLKNYGLIDEFTDLRDQTPGREVNL